MSDNTLSTNLRKMRCEDGEAVPNSNSKDDEGEGGDDDVVTPWDVKAHSAKGVDYEALIVNFGCSSLCDETGNAIVEKLERLSGEPVHPLIRRRLFFAHRDLSTILSRFESGKPFFLYTGRGASSGSLHLGHLIPFIMARYLQRIFKVPLVIQLTDDEKFLWKDISLEEARRYALENIKDILSLGFDPSDTFVFMNTRYMSESPAFYLNVLRMLKCVNINRAQKIFGITASDPIGKMFFPAVEAAPCFSSSFPHIFGKRIDIPCLIPSAIDQDPFFRMTRDEAPRLKYPKPSTIYGQFLPSLEGGAKGKMSSSEPLSCIFLSDTPKQVKQKIGRCFSGGQETLELHRELGGDCDVDIPFQMLRYFFDDDKRLAEIRESYTKGEMTTGELKGLATTTIQAVLAELQERRKQITDASVEEFMGIRSLRYKY